MRPSPPSEAGPGPGPVMPGHAGPARAPVDPRLPRRCRRPRQRRRRDTSLPRILLRHLTDYVGALLALFLAFLGGEYLLRDPTPPVIPPGMPWTQVEVLVLEHDCWTGRAPEGVVPHHAVAQLPGEPPRLVSAAIGFDLWLGPDGIPSTGDERPGLVFAFCP